MRLGRSKHEAIHHADVYGADFGRVVIQQTQRFELLRVSGENELFIELAPAGGGEQAVDALALAVAGVDVTTDPDRAFAMQARFTPGESGHREALVLTANRDVGDRLLPIRSDFRSSTLNEKTMLARDC